MLPVRITLRGYDDGSFRPNDYITRMEAAAAVVKAFGGDKDGSAGLPMQRIFRNGQRLH